MTKRSFRHWQKASKKSISKITKLHTAATTATALALAPAKAMTIKKKKKSSS
jgi:hypothetical protein